MSKNNLFDLFILLLLFIMIAISIGCTTEPVRMFNSDDLEDKGCYLRYGAELGYCLTARADK